MYRIRRPDPLGFAWYALLAFANMVHAKAFLAKRILPQIANVTIVPSKIRAMLTFAWTNRSTLSVDVLV